MEQNGEWKELFPEATREAWREAAEKLLKGAPFNKVLKTKMPEGITLDPIYDRQDTDKLDQIGSMPGFTAYVRGMKPEGFRKKRWQIAQEIEEHVIEDYNKALKNDLARGMTAVSINPVAPNHIKEKLFRSCLCVQTLGDLEKAFDGVDLTTVPLRFNSYASGKALAAMLDAMGKPLMGSLGMDPIGELAACGEIPADAMQDAVHTAKWAFENQPGMNPITIHTEVCHEAGGSAVEELAFFLSSAVEYIDRLTEAGIELETVLNKMEVSFSVGAKFFMEIAKLRAARVLWKNLCDAYGKPECAPNLHIHVGTAFMNKTVYDPYVNMLRTTTEALSGVLGMADSMTVEPFNATYDFPNEFARRIARNTQIILSEESHLDEVIDPAGGSYLIETLTNFLAGEAWNLFRTMEADGGVLKTLESGTLQKRIAEIKNGRDKNLNIRKDVLVGVNMYANPDEQPMIVPWESEEWSCQSCRSKKSGIKPESTDIAAISEAFKNGLTLEEALDLTSDDMMTVEPLESHRLAKGFEDLRTSVMQSEKDKRVFLLNMGSVKQHKARADFSRGFFQVAGYDVIDNKGFATVEDAVKAASENGAPVVIICSTDDTYPELVPPILEGLKNNNPDIVTVLAGYPKDQIEQHKASGIDEFIHVRANAMEILGTIATRIGVEQ